MDIAQVKKVHFIGIGGIGMSALAQLFVHEGKEVSGSDRDPSPSVHGMLEKKGIHVTVGHQAENITDNIELVVYSDAVGVGSLGYVERARAQKLAIPQLSYFEALGEVTRGKKTIAIAGTHGKTTTTGLLAKVLIDAGEQPTVIIGSIMKDFGSNFIPGRSDLFVVEACEYCDHVLKLHPDILVITNIEWDHTDHFPDLEAMQRTFAQAVAKVPPSGCIITNPTHSAIAPILQESKAPVIDYTKEQVPALQLLGAFNAMNARAAKAAAKEVAPQLTNEGLDASLASFAGVWRRFEYKGKTALGAEVYDDYAHHPSAVSVTLKAAREKFPDKNIVVAFHPHLYSRTRDLFDEFAGAFIGADIVLVAPIFAAREEPVEGVTHSTLAEAITEHGVPATPYGSFDEIAEVLQTFNAKHVLITMGAGDIYKVAEKVVH